jgi:SPP1 gp7 family putative phage head morphogenesis protein
VNAGQLETEAELKRLEAKLEKTYKQARDEIQKKLDDYLKKFKVQEKEWRKKLDSGEITSTEYRDWYYNKVMIGRRWTAMRDTLAEDLTNVNVIANNMVRGSMLNTFAINHNYGTYEVENGLSINTSYTLYNADTVANLIKNDPDILKRPSLDRNLDKRWNKKLFQSQITQGILQGESIENLAKRVALGTTQQDMNAAIRNARTATTCAQNAGRTQSYQRAVNLGIELYQVWLAALDSRTRSSHRHMDGEKVKVVKGKQVKFSNGLRFPADPDGRPEEVWNCRCTLVTSFDENEDFTDIKNRANKFDGQSYEEWKEEHKEGNKKGLFKSIEAQVGKDFTNGMIKTLEKTSEEDVVKLFKKFSKDLKVSDAKTKRGAYFSPRDGGVHMNAKNVAKGDNVHKPYQTSFHEFGHNIDYVAGKNAGGTWLSTNSPELMKTIKKDWANFKNEYAKAHLKDVFGDDLEDIYEKIRKGLRTGSRNKNLEVVNKEWHDLAHKMRRKEVTLDEILARDDSTKIMQAVLKDFGETKGDNLIISALQNEDMPLTECGSISDIIEGCTEISCPLGVGHGKAYHNSSSTAKEFFAEVIDGKAANPKSLAQMRRVFPNAVKVVEKMINEVL